MTIKSFNSKKSAWAAILAVTALIVLTSRLRPVWWCYSDEFFAFMGAFCYLCSVYISRLSRDAGRKLKSIAVVFCVMTVVALIAEFVAWQIIED